MHSENNNTPPLPVLPPLRPIAAELMEGLAFILKSTEKEGGGGALDDLSTLEPGHKRQLPTKARSSWERISSAGPILENQGTWEQRGGGGGSDG